MISMYLDQSRLQLGLSKNYRIAVSYINRAAKLATDISDWQGHIDHNTYLETHRTTHVRKSALWSKME